jgi:hypothetical protein
MKINDRVSTPEGDGVVVSLSIDNDMFESEEGPNICVQLDSGDMLYFYSDELTTQV